MRPLAPFLAAIGALALPAAAHAQAVAAQAQTAIPGALDRAFASMNGGPGAGLSLSLQLLFMNLKFKTLMVLLVFVLTMLLLKLL